MLRIEPFARVATATVAALVLSTLSIAAAVGPGQNGHQNLVYASSAQSEIANG